MRRICFCATYALAGDRWQTKKKKNTYVTLCQPAKFPEEKDNWVRNMSGVNTALEEWLEHTAQATPDLLQRASAQPLPTSTWTSVLPYNHLRKSPLPVPPSWHFLSPGPPSSWQTDAGAHTLFLSSFSSYLSCHSSWLWGGAWGGEGEYNQTTLYEFLKERIKCIFKNRWKSILKLYEVREGGGGQW